MRWGETETRQFVKIYLNHEMLWNPRHPLYKDKMERFRQQNSVIDQFMAKTGISMAIIELKIKVKNLKSTYSQEKRKILTRSTPEYEYKPNLQWFSDWDAKMGHFTPTKREAYGVENGEETEHHDSTLWADNSSHDADGDTESDPFADTSYIDIRNDSNNYLNRRMVKESSDKKFKFENDQRYLESSTKPSSTSCHCSRDEFDIYAKHIASQLRSMDLEKALKLQVEIQGLVSAARISDLSGQ